MNSMLVEYINSNMTVLRSRKIFVILLMNNWRSRQTFLSQPAFPAATTLKTYFIMRNKGWTRRKNLSMQYKIITSTCQCRTLNSVLYGVQFCFQRLP